MFLQHRDVSTCIAPLGYPTDMLAFSVRSDLLCSAMQVKKTRLLCLYFLVVFRPKLLFFHPIDNDCSFADYTVF